MKNYVLSPPQGEVSCVLVSLQAIFKRNRIEVSQEEVGRELTREEHGYSITDKKIFDFMKRRGFRYSPFPYNSTPFNSPDLLLNDMSRSEGLIGIDKHVLLLEEFEDPTLKLLDPKDGRLIERDIYDILRQMRETFGVFALIEYIH